MLQLTQYLVTSKVLLVMSRTLIAASTLLAPAALDQLTPDLSGVEAHDGVTSRLLAVVSHKCISLVLEVSHFQNSSELIKCSPQSPLIA